MLPQARKLEEVYVCLEILSYVPHTVWILKRLGKKKKKRRLSQLQWQHHLAGKWNISAYKLRVQMGNHFIAESEGFSLLQLHVFTWNIHSYFYWWWKFLALTEQLRAHFHISYPIIQELLIAMPLWEGNLIDKRSSWPYLKCILTEKKMDLLNQLPALIQLFSCWWE